MRERETRFATLAAILLAGVTIAIILVLPVWKHRGQRSGFSFLLPSPSMAEASGFGSWKEAAEKVKEDRGEPTGRQAAVDIPSELRHYGDTRRFLAIQVAEWRKFKFETPHDFVDLASMIKKGEMVELKSVGENYILYGVGGSADAEPFTRYEKSSGKRIPLYSEAELAEEYAHIDEARTGLEQEVASLRHELNSTTKRERSRRTKLQAQINGREKALKAERERKEQLDLYYSDPQSHQQLLAAYQTLEGLAKDFSDQTYDMTDARSRQQMKVRMLSFLRPEALKVLEEVAGSYRQKFDRPLPVTSLVRPDEYQHMLHRVNPNATLIETPPHSTGLAFDICYRYMTAEEQSYVMADLARLETEGRIEVLRENRDHYHVFAFVDGQRPDETLIGQSLGKNAVKTQKDAPEIKEKADKKEVKRAVRKEIKKDVKKSAVKKQVMSKGKRR
ncbi:MAG TPA: DUF5715 family protein [Pyrinomonadaceae bacterium]